MSLDIIPANDYNTVVSGASVPCACVCVVSHKCVDSLSGSYCAPSL